MMSSRAPDFSEGPASDVEAEEVVALDWIRKLEDYNM